MENHPSMEKLELLQQGKLRGAELLETLRHLQTCDYCFLNQPPQDPDELLNRIFKDDDDISEEDDISEFEQ